MSDAAETSQFGKKRRVFIVLTENAEGPTGTIADGKVPPGSPTLPLHRQSSAGTVHGPGPGSDAGDHHGSIGSDRLAARRCACGRARHKKSP